MQNGFMRKHFCATIIALAVLGAGCTSPPVSPHPHSLSVKVQFPAHMLYRTQVIYPITRAIYVVVYGTGIPMDNPRISEALTPDSPGTTMRELPAGLQTVLVVAYDGKKGILTADKRQVTIEGKTQVEVDLTPGYQELMNPAEISLLENLNITLPQPLPTPTPVPTPTFSGFASGIPLPQSSSAGRSPSPTSEPFPLRPPTPVSTATPISGFAIVMSQPSSGTNVTSGSKLTLEASITNTSSSIVREVIFYIDGNIAGSVKSSPYQYIWSTSGLSTGTHTLKVAARNTLGQLMGESSTMSVSITGSEPTTTGTPTPSPTATPTALPSHFSIATMAGRGLLRTADNVTALQEVSLLTPNGLSANASGDIYVADSDDHRILQITAAGKISTFAGSGLAGFSGNNTAALDAMLNRPYQAFHSADLGGAVLIADTFNHCIRKVDNSGIITTFAGNCGASGYAGDGGVATNAGVRLNYPKGLAIDTNSGYQGDVYIADTGNHVIRVIPAVNRTNYFGIAGFNLIAGNIYKLAGNPLTAAFSGDGNPISGIIEFNTPSALNVDVNTLYIADSLNHRVRNISKATGTVATAAGDGTVANLNTPIGLTLNGTNLLIADKFNHRIREHDTTGTPGNMTTLAGSGTQGYLEGVALTAQFAEPLGLLYRNPSLFISDSLNRRIRLQTTDGTVSTYVGNGTNLASQNMPLVATRLLAPKGLCFQSAGLNQGLYFTDNNRLLMSPIDANAHFGVAMGKENNVYRIAGGGGALGDSGPGTSAQLNDPHQVAIDNFGEVYVADTGNHRIRFVNASGTITTAVGNGATGYNDNVARSAANLRFPRGVAVNSDKSIYIADTDNHAIRMAPGIGGTFYGIDMLAGNVYTLAGTSCSNGVGCSPGFNFDPQPGPSARLNKPWGIALDAQNNLLIADRDNHRVRMLIAVAGTYYGQGMSVGQIYTIAGTGIPQYTGDLGLGVSAGLKSPEAIALDTTGNLYIADTGNRLIRVVAMSTGIIYTLAGNGSGTFAGDSATALTNFIGSPAAMAVKGADIWFASSDHALLRRLFIP